MIFSKASTARIGPRRNATSRLSSWNQSCSWPGVTSPSSLEVGAAAGEGLGEIEDVADARRLPGGGPQCLVLAGGGEEDVGEVALARAGLTATAASCAAPSFPHAAQVLSIRRDTYDLTGAAIAEGVVHGITSLNAAPATAGDLARLTQGQWESSPSTGCATTPTPKTRHRDGELA